MNTTTCFAPAHILLPAEQIPLEQWGCIACDQFTSDREYWQRAKEAADGSPSTLNLILPEVYLEDGDADARVEQIHATMADYAQNVLTRAVDGFVYVERTERSGRVRQGLVGKVDLEVVSDPSGTPLQNGQAYFVRYKDDQVGPFFAFADAAAMHEALRQGHPEAEVVLDDADN